MLQTQEKLHLEEKLQSENSKNKSAINEQIKKLNYNLSRSFGLRGLIRNITGQNKRDVASVHGLKVSAAAILRAEQMRRDTLATRHKEENRQAAKQEFKERSSVNAQILDKQNQLKQKIDIELTPEKPQTVKGNFRTASTQSNDNKPSRQQGRKTGRGQGRSKKRDGKEPER